MDKILLIVDPQVDFISGSLAVEGAKALASALQNGEIDCDYVMVTKDFHPSNHCSLKRTEANGLHIVLKILLVVVYMPHYGV